MIPNEDEFEDFYDWPRGVSTKILVIPEDPKYNGYILKPIAERILSEAGRPRAQITVLPRSRYTGITNVKDAIRHELAGAWRWMDLWLFLPDADRTNDAAAADIERELAQEGIPLICCPANPEVEAWMLVGHRHHLNINWAQVTGHPHFKEEVFEPFMQHHGYPELPGDGRGKLTLETLANYAALKQRCPELERLDQRVREFFADRP